jgi:linoleoyl-CoA desaturase
MSETRADSGGFYVMLRRRVDEYFRTTGLPVRGLKRMYVKTVVHLAAFAGIYALLVFAAATAWQAVLLSVLLGLVVAGIGFNIQHDASHGAYSRSRRVNRLLALTLDLMGGSSYVWRTKHNRLHHTSPNVPDRDDDIDIGFLGRLSPAQRRLPPHRFQHLYLWILYGFLPAKWLLFDDFLAIAKGRIGSSPMKRPGPGSLAVLLAGKAVFLALAFVVPMLLHPVWTVLACYAIASMTLGLTLSVVFQLAHCVEEAEFPAEDGEEADFARRQLASTVNFAPGNPVLTWLLGGLNHQVEHHLFPKVCHVHYPALSRIVRDLCEEAGIRYRSNRTFLGAVASHYRWLWRMGRPQPV